MIQAVVSGELKFYFEPLPWYAAPGVSAGVEGIAKSLSYTIGNDDYYEGGNKTITGTYKWILLSDTHTNASEFGRIIVNGTGGSGNSLDSDGNDDCGVCGGDESTCTGIRDWRSRSDCILFIISNRIWRNAR